MITTTVRHRLVVLAVLVMASVLPARAQYDRDGRYVPSPMGVPADPYARPVPLHPGTPGPVVGTPAWPRALELRPQPIPAPSPRIETPLSSGRLPLVYLSADQCREGWNRSTGVSRVEFNRRCARILKK